MKPVPTRLDTVVELDSIRAPNLCYGCGADADYYAHRDGDAELPKYTGYFCEECWEEAERDPEA